MVRALKAMYSTVKACIRYNQSYSDFIDSNFGVKQGDPSSPMLFMMFINDLNENINNDLEGIFTLNGIKLFLLLYADDQVVFGKITRISANNAYRYRKLLQYMGLKNKHFKN